MEIYDSVVRAKLLYGLDSVAFNSQQKLLLDIFHRKGLRQICRITTTYVDRRHNNDYVFNYANSKIREENPTAEPILPLSVKHEELRIKMLYKIILANNDNPLKALTFQTNTLLPVDLGVRRSGRPRCKWTEETLADAWRRITIYPFKQFIHTTFQPNNVSHCNILTLAAKHTLLGKVT